MTVKDGGAALVASIALFVAASIINEATDNTIVRLVAMMLSGVSAVIWYSALLAHRNQTEKE